MGLISWLFSKEKETPSFGEAKKTPSQPPPTVMLNGGGAFSLDVVGESHYQEDLERICGGRTYESQEKLVEAVLVHDDGNPYDEQAIRVDIQGHTVGYLDRERARQFRKKMIETGHRGIKATCDAKIVGGWEREEFDKGDFGVKLDLPDEFLGVRDAPTPKDTYEEDSTGSKILTFDVFDLQQGQLSSCSINDPIKVWILRDGMPRSEYAYPDKISLYPRGGYGRLGFVPDKYSEVVTSHLKKDLPYEASITELTGDRCRVKCKLISQEEAALLQTQEKQKFEVEMAKKYTPKKGFEFSIELPKRHKLREGQLLFLDKEPIEDCTERLGEFGLRFVDEKNKVVAHKRWEKDKIQRILRARNSGYQLVITIKSMEHPDKFDLKYIDFIRGTARVDFQKTNDQDTEKGSLTKKV